MTSIGTTTGRQAGFDMVKLEEAVHYICSTVTAKDRLGAIKLNKILYYADMLHYVESGESITGATYVKRPQGPVPKQVLPAIENLCREGRLEYQNISVFDMVRREFSAFGHTKSDVLSVEETETISRMIRFVCDCTAKEISEFSHTTNWEVANLGQAMPYESFFTAYPGECDEVVLAEAIKELNRVEQESGFVYA